MKFSFAGRWSTTVLWQDWMLELVLKALTHSFLCILLVSLHFDPSAISHPEFFSLLPAPGCNTSPRSVSLAQYCRFRERQCRFLSDAGVPSPQPPGPESGRHCPHHEPILSEGTLPPTEAVSVCACVHTCAGVCVSLHTSV